MSDSGSRRRSLRRRGIWAGSALALGLVLAACGGGSSDSGTTTGGATGTTSPPPEPAESISVAFLASSSQNGYNQAVYEGIEIAASQIGNVETTIFDGQFDGTVQFNQLQDVATSGEYDAIVIVPNDTVGIAAAVESADSKGIPVVTVLFPIGPDLTDLEPQVPGIVSTVASPPAEGARKQAELVAEYCADLDPCNVVILIGQLQFPFDKVRYDAYNEVLAQYPNIKVVATAQGNYDRDQSLTEMTNVIQANPDINAVLSNADQQTAGAQIALEQAGIDLSTVYLTGGGGTIEAIQAVRDGKWASDYVNFPVSMGEAALVQAVNAVTGQPVTPVIDADTLGPVPPFVNREILADYPDFLGQWAG